jgi:hypothetical protein
MNMKRFIVGAAAVAVLSAVSSAVAQPITAVVTLTGADIRVQPERIEVRRSQGAVVIRWDLPSGANYNFHPEGIVINGEVTRQGLTASQDQIANCSGGPRHVTCTNRNSRRGNFKYTVRLLDQNQRLIEKDPFIVNID